MSPKFKVGDFLTTKEELEALPYGAIVTYAGAAFGDSGKWHRVSNGFRSGWGLRDFTEPVDDIAQGMGPDCGRYITHLPGEVDDRDEDEADVDSVDHEAVAISLIILGVDIETFLRTYRKVTKLIEKGRAE